VDPGAPSDTWYTSRQAEYVTAIEAAAAEILDAIPPEGTLVDADEQLHWQESIGKVIAARTAVYAPPLGPFNRTCKSRRTCELSQQLAAVPNNLGLTLLPGAVGSEFTHFGTSRADLPIVNECGSDSGGGGPPPSGCVGPQLRGHRGRFYPLDPELDGIMQCTLASFTASTPTTRVVGVDLEIDPSCLLTDDPPEDPPADPPPAADAAHADEAELEEVRQAVVQLLESDSGLARFHGYTRDQMVAAIADATGATPAQILAVMAQVAGGVLSNPVSSWTRDGNNVPGAPMETRNLRNDATGETIPTGIAYDEANMDADLAIVVGGAAPGLEDHLAQEYMMRRLLHESAHMVLTELSNQGLAPSNLGDRSWHHDVTSALGLTRATQSCGVDDTQCSTRCGFSDARMKRFSDCLAGESPPFDRCAVAEDYCEDRSLGTLEFMAGPTCGAPTIEFPPLCATVNCGTSSDLADACCGGTPGAPADPLPYSGFGASPGPHPGDPDGPFASVPGGPGGVPFPPTPPGM
jgi:hypothetical protein